MRGKVSAESTVFGISGITPAYAGKSVSYEKLPSVNKDHPRLCGEKCVAKRQIVRILGSPPPMRGKVAMSLVYTQSEQDHPRLCGEKPAAWQRIQ